jgi:putative DNA primase/helicase
MEFINFCQALGIVINTPPPLGVWRRYPTVDHPRKRNGAVKWMGDHGFAQNHALDTEVSVWKDDKVTEGAKRDFQKLANEAEMERLRMQKQAADKAATILKQCQFGKHEYLKAKGFEDEEGNIWAFDGKQFLIIPMRVDGHLVGLQIIDNEGTKKFLYGQRTAGAEFCFDNKGPHILCEGYATGLSIRKALKNMKKRYTIHVCFSAGNMKKIASTIEGTGLIVADNDESGTGERTAKEIGWQYWMSDVVGEDFNDAHQRLGLFKVSYALARLVDQIATSSSCSS